MIPVVQFALWMDDITRLMSLEPGSRAYKKALAALRKDMDFSHEELSPACAKWDRIVTISTLTGLLSFICMIILAVWGKRFLTPGSPASETIVWCVLGILLLSDACAIFAQIKINRICRDAFQASIDRVWARMKVFPSQTLKYAKALYRNDSGDELLEIPCRSEKPCGCYRCEKVFPAKDFAWNHEPDYPLCPHCQSGKYLVYDGKKAALTIEGLSVLHALFIEE